MVNRNIKGPKKPRRNDFWDNYEDEIGEFVNDDDDGDYNDGDWEEYEE
ncbi:MAG: hypothetical protein ACFFAS_19205 [Promethearchaeota archaeon]